VRRNSHCGGTGSVEEVRRAGPGASRHDIGLEWEAARGEAGRAGLVEAEGSHRNPAEAGARRMSQEVGLRYSLEEYWVARHGTRLPRKDSHLRKAADPRPAGADTGAAAGTRPGHAGRHTRTANLASRILT